MDGSTPSVVNTHHFGGVDKLPSNVLYIGRPSSRGNAYSSASGKYTKEECVALHKVDLYRSCIQDPDFLPTLRKEMEGKDLACWCKQPKRIVACHGDNFLHVLSDRLAARVYDKSILTYLMDDLRFLLNAFDEWIRLKSDDTDYIFLFIHFGDVRLSIVHVLGLCREKFVNTDDLHFFIALLVVELDLAYKDTDPKMIEYRFDHICWGIDRFITNRTDRDHEPISPYLPIKRKSAKEAASL